MSIDYWANPPPEVYKKTFPEFIAIIRAKHPNTPIVVTGPYYNPSETFGSRMGQYQLEKRQLIPQLVEAKQKAGDKNIHYVDGFDSSPPIKPTPSPMPATPTATACSSTLAVWSPPSAAP